MQTDTRVTEPSLLGLPTEIIDQICSNLGARSFLNFTAVSKAAHHALTNDWVFWSTLIRKNFRHPNQPVIEQDGKRWRLLYKRLQSDTRAYTWGKAGALGHSEVRFASDGYPPVLNNMRIPANCITPRPVERTEQMGAVVDLQCGGWSTVMLSSTGMLYILGEVDPEYFPTRHRVHAWHPEPLNFPSGFARPDTRHEPATVIRQFSVGRSHILAIADSGRIWSWTICSEPALHVKFIHHTTVENRSMLTRGTVKKVVAGWSLSAALIEGTGIVIWKPCRRPRNATELSDLALVDTSLVVPQTSLSRSLRAQQSERHPRQIQYLETTVGEVRNFIMWDKVVLFVTDIGKVFAANILWDDDEQRVFDPVEVPLEGFAQDIQGAHERLGLFMKSGAVLMSTLARINRLIRKPDSPEAGDIFITIPALQNSNVIQLAFGDWHFHALHADGRITSYGEEPGGCGALGLGALNQFERRLRTASNSGLDMRLDKRAYAVGRTVWFEKCKYKWLSHLHFKGAESSEASDRFELCVHAEDRHAADVLAEWVEQESRDWEHKYDVINDQDDGLPAYFALSVAAAGWHSGALVLVNQDLADRVEKATISNESSGPIIEFWDELGVRHVVGSNVWDKESFPRLRLTDGIEMPGSVPFNTWRYGEPPFNEDLSFEI